MVRSTLMWCLVMLVLATAVAEAEEFFPLVNPSFEDPVIPEGVSAYYVTPGWSQYGQGAILGTYHPLAGQADNCDGENVSFGYGAVGGGLRQDVGFSYVALETYTLTVKICRPGQYYDWNVPHVSLGKIALCYADTGNELASHTETIWVDHPAWGTMADYSVEYTATVADEAHGIQIRLVHMDGDGVYFDAVRLSYTGSPLPPQDCAAALAAGYSQVGDLNEDCHVNIEDMAIMSGHWLGCIDPETPGCAEPWL